jgi:hypothetical protein
MAIVVSDMQRAYEWLRQQKVAHFSSGPQRLPDWNENAASMPSYLRASSRFRMEALDSQKAFWSRTLMAT